MSFKEISFRVNQLLVRKYFKAFYKGFKPSIDIEKFNLPDYLLPDSNVENFVELYQSQISIFGIKWDYENDPNWFYDISTKREFPKEFAFDINTRSDENAIAKYVWEINRHQCLLREALNYKKTGNKDHLNKFTGLLISWAKQNPFMIGVNWYSNIEVSCRLITWFFCWHILDANALYNSDERFKSFVNDTFLPQIYLHCFYSYSFPSKFSSANNHRLAEVSGLFIASSFWKFPESKKWNTYAKAGLEKEIVNQHSANGINREEASEYIQFITDFLLFPLIVATRTNNELSQTYSNYIKKIFEYISEIVDQNGYIDHYGDADDGYILNPYTISHEFNNFLSLLTTSRVLFGMPNYNKPALTWDWKNELIFGNEGKARFQNVNADIQNKGSVFYRDEGHFIFRKAQDEKELIVHFDAAPLGFLSTAAHGHADALSFHLIVDGEPIIVDTGTYTYHSEVDWRDYFTGTLAHNTICINDLNQSVRKGPMLWHQHYSCSIHNVEENDEFEKVTASHDGYRNINLGHERSIEFDKVNGDYFNIFDSIVGDPNQKYDLKYPIHLHPDVSIQSISGNQVDILSKKGTTIRLLLDPERKVEWNSFEATDDKKFGWYSPHFYKKIKSKVLLFNEMFQGSTELTLRISIIRKDDDN